MDEIERPQYYDGEYLGADDLSALVRYARTAQARHALGAHVWGIAAGLEIVERTLPTGDVEEMVSPGVAWDGLGRGLVALAPQRVSLDLFANFEDDTAPEGIPVEVWLAYRELPAGPPGVGFACPDDDLHDRAVETFRLELRRAPVADYHGVTVAGRAVAARDAAKLFDPAAAPLYDESVPAQRFPDEGNAPRWPVFVGVVRWRKDAAQPGRLIARTDDDRNATRRGRRHVGVVAESIAAPGGVLRLRDRSRDPNDPTLNYAPPIVAAPPGTTVVNDLVWCEGHLRVVGDARLQDGKLDFRVARGGDAGVPMYLRRTTVNAPVVKTTLDAFVGPPAPVPANAQTRFTVSTTDAANNAKECLTVVTDGRVGVNAADPTNTLHVDGPTGIRYGYGYLTGDVGAAWTALAFNAYSPPGGPWVFPDGAHRPAAVVLDDAGGVPALRFQTSITANPAAWDVHLTVKGDTGNVGIGTAAPAAKLHVHSANPLQGDLRIFSPTADVEYDGGTDKLFVVRDTAGGVTAILGTKLGLGTAQPKTALQVVGDRVRLGDDAKRLDLRVDGAQVDLHSETHDLYIRTLGDAAHPGKRNVVINPDNANEGNVGVGTTNPVYKLDVNGTLRVSGFAYKTTGIYWAALSDARLKRDIAPIERALDRVLSLRGVTFSWREPERIGAGAGRQMGLVAQEVEETLPEWVMTTEAGDKAINPVGFEALVIEALREMNAKCTHLEARVDELRAQLERERPRRRVAGGAARKAADAEAPPDDADAGGKPAGGRRGRRRKAP